MLNIRSISDLRNNFTEISNVVQETAEPVFLTKNGYGDTVVMSVEAYERLEFQNDVYFRLKEAELDNKNCSEKYSHDKILDTIKQELEQKVSKDAI